MPLAVLVDFAGTGVDVSASFLAFFAGFCLLLVVLALYFNLSGNHDEWYLDEHWGDASIDDDDWGFSIAEARRATNRKLAELADRDGARAASS
jgi:hypothetical protein